MEYWRSLFPFLDDFLGGGADDDLLLKILADDLENPIHDIADVGVDPVRLLAGLSQEEYNRLSPVERNTRAFQAWKRRPKTNWQLGRDYERYIGWCHEQRGYAVTYQGILEGYEDLGRDLIAKNGQHTLVIQCKRWSAHKKIHEKHVNQLFGTLTKYRIDHREEDVQGELYVTNELSLMAREFARVLGISLHEQFPYDDNYPIIKCNVSRATGERIYHLPFDQQYDTTIIEPFRGESYVATVEEAEKLGFRRAWRWHPEVE